MKGHLSDKEIKHAVHELCLAVANWDAAPAVPYKLSDRFTSNLRTMLLASEKRLKRRKRMLRIAACFVVLIIAFSLTCIAYPPVWAAVKSWYVNIVDPNRLIYEFNHEENDHAFLVVRPDNLPKGFELNDLDEGDGYSNQLYSNNETGEYLRFSYHWATVGDLKRLEKLEKKYGHINIFMGQQAVAYTENDLSMLCWYDKYSQICYLAESNMDQDLLVSIFKESIEMHPPVYEPTWLPEGYVLYDSYLDASTCEKIYHNENSGEFIVISCVDQGESERVFVDGDGESREALIKGNKATVYWGEEIVHGTVLVMVDESAHIVFVIDIDAIDPDVAVKIAESLEMVEAYSRVLP